MRDGDRRGDPAACSPATFEGRTARFDDFEEVIENSVRHVFVENPLVSELLQVELEAFELHAFSIRNVPENQRTEVRLAGFGADRSELGAKDFDGILSVRVRVIEALELVGKRCSWHGGGFWGKNWIESGMNLQRPRSDRLTRPWSILAIPAKYNRSSRFCLAFF